VAEYRMQGSELYDRNKNRLGYARENTVFDAVNRRMGYLRGNDIYDSTNRRMAYMRDADVYSSSNNRMGRIEEFQKRIDKAPEGALSVALLILLAKPADA
jgi:5-fold beta-flower domain-containing protein